MKVGIERLEMTRGHDGFLRGHPEPALLLGYFRAGDGRLVLGERLLARFRPRDRYPLVAPAVGLPGQLQVRVGAIPDHLLLILAFEEDGGTDLQRFHALLDDFAALSVWDVAADIPTPVPLADAAGWRGRPRRVRILDGARDVAERCDADKLIDSVVVPLERRIRRDVLRVPLRSDDGRNDWTAQVLVQVTTT